MTTAFTLPSSLSISIINCARHVARLESKLDSLFSEHPEKENDETTSPYFFTSPDQVFSQHVDHLATTFQSIMDSTTDLLTPELSNYLASLHIRIQALQSTSVPMTRRVHASAHPEPLAHLRREIKGTRKYEAKRKKELMKQTLSPKAPPPSSAPMTLDHHAALQAKLASGLASMAAQLKANSKAFSEHLQVDAKALHDAANALSQNQTRMGMTAQRLKQYTTTSRWTAWTLFLFILVMCLVTLVMYIVIRIF